MIGFYYWPTPNGWKISIMLEECGLPYRMIPVNIGRGDQFKPEFLAISPNGRMPAIVDHGAGREPVPGVPVPRHPAPSGPAEWAVNAQSEKGRKETLEWLFWQVGMRLSSRTRTALFRGGTGGTRGTPRETARLRGNRQVEQGELTSDYSKSCSPCSPLRFPLDPSFPLRVPPVPPVPPHQGKVG